MNVPGALLCRRAATLVWGAAVLSLAACASGSSPSPTSTTAPNVGPVLATKQAYLSAADAVCLAGQQAEARLGARPAAMEKLPVWLDASMAIVRRDLRSLRGLPAPPADSAMLQHLYADLDAAIAAAPAVDRAAASADAAAVDKAWGAMRAHIAAAAAVARSYGLRICGASAGGGARAQPTPIALAPELVSVPDRYRLHAPTVYRQDDSAWSNVLPQGAFARRGSVPTAVATLLSLFGISSTPAQVAASLRGSGVWTPGSGTSWDGLRSALADHHLRLADSSLSEAASTYAPALRPGDHGVAYLVAWTARGGDPRDADAGTLLVLTDYSASSDSFEVLDPGAGQRRLRFADLAAGMPWVLSVRGGVG